MAKTRTDHYGDAEYWNNLFAPQLSAPVITAPPTPVPPPTPAPVVPDTPVVDPLVTAKNAAKQRAMQLISQRGLDPNQFAALIDSEIERIGSSLTSPDQAKTAFNDNLASNVLTGEESRLRNEQLKAADQKFGSDYGNRKIASTLLDDTISSILQEQRGNASQFLERGKARGIYNDIGYTAGRTALDSAGVAARAKLSSMGGDVLNRYRSDANAVRDKAYGAASSFSLGRPIDLDAYAREGDEVANRAMQFGGGDLRNLVGGTNFFDFSGLANKAGVAQGAQNLRDTDVATALAERRRLSYSRRGLGSQGVF